MSDRYRDRPFPQDDQYGRGSHSTQPQAESDPLAELARLIGQTDPFSNFGREHREAAPRRTEQRAPRAEETNFYDEQDYQETQPQPPAWVRHSQEAAYGRSQAQPQDHYPEPSFTRDPAPRDPFAANAHYDDFPPRYDQHAYGHEQADPNRYDDVLFGEDPNQQQDHDQYGAYDPRYDDPSFAPRDDVEAESPKRRGGLATVLVVLALAVLGTAGAYAYRSFVGSPRSGEPPVIKADAGPNKIVPAGSGDSKQIYDRVGDKNTERVVSREEQPVDVNSRASGPRVVFPPLAQNNSPPSTSTVTPDSRPTGPDVANGTLNGEAPRKIRTLTIKPDQPDVADPSASARSPAAAQAVPARQQTTASLKPPAGSAPVALTPQAPPAADPRSRVASINPSASVPSGGGSFVQISSQKTEADALGSYKVLQGKYPGILGSRQPMVRRADLGDKGVYYRALVGPFTSTDEATQFCLNLQSAGGKCIVQRN